MNKFGKSHWYMFDMKFVFHVSCTIRTDSRVTLMVVMWRDLNIIICWRVHTCVPKSQNTNISQVTLHLLLLKQIFHKIKHFVHVELMCHIIYNLERIS